ncbi:aminoacyl--tRNA ligase-related protein [Bradyrhizobium sp. NBAIM08]|uniref:aminoacyl--tRNA ligase-related protein n=1 Tax=Bradyrhizobium sp. NBAIM08 TaxID=2793815 RepID=UPI001CD5005B|nr:aminoacyl--tRNA ligase-related protein [Bradyrhizobium sp. NBAIM08]MCA1479804.1 hypothetical protein [Bradyrhizobium sp. NBAIM08]
MKNIELTPAPNTLTGNNPSKAAPSIEALFSTSGGMATFTDRGHAIIQQLEVIFLDWASFIPATNIRYPSLIPIADLDRLNYFRNFPHLALCACAISESACADFSKGQDDLLRLDHRQLQSAEFCLPPAACYNVYLSMRGQHLSATRCVTTVANCFRNEDHYQGLRRLRAFTLREIVFVGRDEDVKTYLRKYRAIALEFLGELGLTIEVKHASDPFFDKASTAARATRIFPTKEELLFNGTLAIASLNYHRRFFGERCGITIEGEPAHTGCIGFGLERWVYALTEHFGTDTGVILDRLQASHSAVMSHQSASQ